MAESEIHDTMRIARDDTQEALGATTEQEAAGHELVMPARVEPEKPDEPDGSDDGTRLSWYLYFKIVLYRIAALTVFGRVVVIRNKNDEDSQIVLGCRMNHPAAGMWEGFAAFRVGSDPSRKAELRTAMALPGETVILLVPAYCLKTKVICNVCAPVDPDLFPNPPRGYEDDKVTPKEGVTTERAREWHKEGMCFETLLFYPVWDGNSKDFYNDHRFNAKHRRLKCGVADVFSLGPFPRPFVTNMTTRGDARWTPEPANLHYPLGEKGERSDAHYKLMGLILRDEALKEAEAEEETEARSPPLPARHPRHPPRSSQPPRRHARPRLHARPLALAATPSPVRRRRNSSR